MWNLSRNGSARLAAGSRFGLERALITTMCQASAGGRRLGTDGQVCEDYIHEPFERRPRPILVLMCQGQI
eukprot:522196-Lingulodinium_polyedra.AAC.1